MSNAHWHSDQGEDVERCRGCRSVYHTDLDNCLAEWTSGEIICQFILETCRLNRWKKGWHQISS